MDNNPPQEKARIANYIAFWLKSQLDFWCSQGIIDQSQKEKIKNLYFWPQEKTPTAAEKSPLRLVTIIEIIGVLLIGIGVISFIAFNWQKITSFTKLIIVVCACIISHLSGLFFWRRKPNLQKAGLSIIFLANLLYGAGIWLIAQTYHIHTDFATGIFLWALGIVPFAYLLKSRLNYFFAIALFILWTFTEAISYQKPHLVFLFILLGVMIPLAHYLKSKTGLIISLITAAIWLLINNLFWFGQNFSIILFLPLYLYASLLIISSPLHLLKENYHNWRGPYLYTGIVILAGTLFLLPFFGVFQQFSKSIPYTFLSLHFWLFNLVLVLGIVGSLLLFPKMNEDKTTVLIKQMTPSFLLSALAIVILPYFKTSLLINLLPVLFVVFSHWQHSRLRLLVNFSLIYFFIWLPFCLVNWKQPFTFFVVLLLYGNFCYILGWFYLAKFNAKVSATLFKALGLLAIFFSLYILSFSSIAQYFSRHYTLIKNTEFWYIIICLYCLLIFLYRRGVSAFNHPSVKYGRLREERAVTLIFSLLPIIFFILICAKLTGFWYIFFINFSFIGLLITFIAAGYRRQELSLKVISFLFLILLVGARYLEMQWSLFHKAVLFIITGIIVLAVGIIFEKNKDKVVIIEK
jgi:hypothetical protein